MNRELDRPTEGNIGKPSSEADDTEFSPGNASEDARREAILSDQLKTEAEERERLQRETKNPTPTERVHGEQVRNANENE